MIGRTILQAGMCVFLVAGPVAAEFRFSFDWAGLESCTTGSPNTVSNPRFEITDLPQGTTFVRFGLTDLDVPNYDHGGGWAEISGDGMVPADAFKYQSPCPPSGRHTYQWSATAVTKKGGKVLGKARAKRPYP